MECLLSNGDVIKPDIALISWKRAATAQPTGPSQRLILHGCPELVVETRSPSNRRAQERRKRELYFSNRAEVVWDVDMRGKRIYVYRAQSPLQPEVYEVGDVIGVEPFLPGWQRRVADIFSAQASAEAVAGEVATAWIAEGRLEGHAEGIAEGRMATLRSLLPTLARYRFGAELAPAVLARLNACTEAQLLHLQTRIESAATLDEWIAAIPR
ncbi:MAG: Uma2 family endonuclease, partial [Anaerolineae bacterium]